MSQASYPDFLDWKHTAKSFQSLAGFAGDGFAPEIGGELALGTQVTPNFFSTLGVKPSLVVIFCKLRTSPMVLTSLSGATRSGERNWVRIRT